MRQETIALYKFDELSDSSKKKALEKYKENRESDNDSDFIHEFIQDFILEAYGIEAEDIRFRLSYSQGDGIAFYGSLNLKILCDKHLKLKSLADKLGGLDNISGKISGANSHYHHWNSMRFQFDDFIENIDEKASEEFCDEVNRILTDASKDAEAKAYEVLESFTHDDSLTEEILQTDMEFTADGREYTF